MTLSDPSMILLECIDKVMPIDAPVGVRVTCKNDVSLTVCIFRDPANNTYYIYVKTPRSEATFLLPPECAKKI